MVIAPRSGHGEQQHRGQGQDSACTEECRLRLVLS